ISAQLIFTERMVSDAEAPPLGCDVEERHACCRPISVPRRVSVRSLNSFQGDGFGDPGGRDPAAVVAGVSYGYLSRDMARDVSGVWIDDPVARDQDATGRRRAEIRRQPCGGQPPNGPGAANQPGSRAAPRSCARLDQQNRDAT